MRIKIFPTSAIINERECKNFSLPPLLPVPPEQPTILDQWGRIVNGTAGPYEEGDTPSLTCRVTGGKYLSLSLSLSFSPFEREIEWLMIRKRQGKPINPTFQLESWKGRRFVRSVGYIRSAKFLSTELSEKLHVRKNAGERALLGVEYGGGSGELPRFRCLLWQLDLNFCL